MTMPTVTIPLNPDHTPWERRNIKRMIANAIRVLADYDGPVAVDMVVPD